MWSLVLVLVEPFAQPFLLGELSRHESFDQCVYSQNNLQSDVTAINADSILFCVKDFKNTFGVEQ
jgi:hypothetical protein